MEIINGDCLEELKKMEENSVDSICCDPPYGLSFMGKNTYILYGKYDTMGLWKHFGTKLKKQILVGYGLAQIMVQVMAKFVLKTKRFTRTGCLMSGRKEKYQKATRLTTYVESPLVVILNTWKWSRQKLMSIVEIQQNHTLLKLIV